MLLTSWLKAARPSRIRRRPRPRCFAAAERLEDRTLPSGLSLTVTLDRATVSEGAGPSGVTGTVTRSGGDLSQPLVVTLTSSDTSEATVPASVTIAAGATSATFAVDVVNDSAVDGTQTVTISAAAHAAAGTVGLDPSFGTGGVAPTSLRMHVQWPRAAVGVQRDGKIVAAGEDDHTGSWRLTRLNADGSLDTGFGQSGVTVTRFGESNHPVPHVVVVQPDGKILVGGKAASGVGTSLLARYNADGTPDASFGTGGIADLTSVGGWIEDVAVRPDGKIMLAVSFNGTSYFRAVRLTANGALDSSFGTAGVKTYTSINELARSVSLLADGGFLLAGGSAVARFDAAGNLVAAFGTGGVRQISFGPGSEPDILHSEVLPDGRIVLGGYVWNQTAGYDFMAARLTADGALDTSFSGDGLVRSDFSGELDYPTSMFVQADGKVVLAGFIEVSAGVRDVALARYTVDGALDASFDGDGILSHSLITSHPAEMIFSVAPQRDGKLVALGGWHTDYRVARYDLGLAVATSETALGVVDDETATAVVDILADEDDGNYAAGDLSLREAVKIVAAGGTVTFASALTGGTVTLGGTQIVLNRNVTIDGLGADRLTVSGNSTSRVFQVAAGVTAAIKGLTLTRGKSDEAGGAVVNAGTLILTDVVVSASSAQSSGGGIANEGTLTFSGGTITGNSAASWGGGIANTGTLHVTGSSVTGNAAASFGGGIDNTGGLQISESTVAANTSGSSGGGISNFGGALLASNVTISGNAAAGDGGGVYSTGGPATLRNVTVFGNRADSDGNASGVGGGIRVNSGAVRLYNGVVAGNVRGTAAGVASDVSGTLDSASRNDLVGDAASAGGLVNGVNGHLVGVDWATVLDPVLRANGGLTKTHALLPGSAAVDAGLNAQALGTDGNALAFDQRGTGYPRVLRGRVDIGAFELPNSPPAAKADVFSTDEDTVLTGSVLVDNGSGTDGDPDRDRLTVISVNGVVANVGKAVVLASGAKLTVNADGTFSFDPAGAFQGLAAGQSATVSFTYVVSDGHGGTATAGGTVTVAGRNDRPVARPDAAEAGEDGVVTIPVLGNDSDADAGASLHIASVDATGLQGTVRVNADGTLSYDPGSAFQHLAAGQTAVETFTYTASDGEGGTATATVTVTVTGGNDGPVARADAVSAGEDAALAGNLFADNGSGPDADVDGDALTVTSVNGAAADVGRQVTLASGAKLMVNADGTFVFDPAGAFEHLAAGQTAGVTFAYTVSDGHGGTSMATATVTVAGANDRPVAQADSAGVGEDGTVAIAVLGNDSDVDAGDVLRVASVDVAGLKGAVRVNADGTLTYDPGLAFGHLAAGETATETFTYAVSDGQGAIATAVVTVTVTGANDPPAAEPDAGSVAEHGLLTGNVLTNDSDPDGDALSVSSVGGSAASVGATVTLASGARLRVNADGTYSYDPAGAFVRLRRGETATDSFAYTISDGQGGTATAAVTVTIEGGGGEADLVAFLAGGWWVGASDGTKFATSRWAGWSNAAWGALGQADFSGDGRSDVFGLLNGQWWVGTSTGSAYQTRLWAGWSNAAWQDVKAADLNGDGKADVLARLGSRWWAALSTGNSFAASKAWGSLAGLPWREFFTADVDGDRDADLLGFAKGQWWAWASNGSGFAAPKQFAGWSDAAWQKVLVLDADGDGKDDVAGLLNGQWWVGRSTGAAFTTARWGAWSNIAWTDPLAGDFNGDGKDDVAARNGGNWWVGLSTGSAFAAPKPWAGWSNVAWKDVRIGDFDGDGRDDLAGRFNGQWRVGRSTGAAFASGLWGTWSEAAWRAVGAVDATGPPPGGVARSGAASPASVSAAPSAPLFATAADDEPLTLFWTESDKDDDFASRLLAAR